MASDADFELAKIRFRRLYQKATELKIKDKDIAKFDFVLKYKENKLNIVVIILKWIAITLLLLCLVSLSLYGAVQANFIASKTIAEWSTVFTGIDLKKDPCIYLFSKNLLDVFRPPVDCTFCHGITGFERVQNLSPEVFVKKYAYSGRPVIITDATQNWTATEKFSFDYFKTVYKKDSPVLHGGEREFQFFSYKTELHIGW